MTKPIESASLRLNPNCLECGVKLEMDKRQYAGLCSVLCEAEYNVKMKTPAVYFQFWPESLGKGSACTVEAKELAGCLEDADEPYFVVPITMSKAEFLDLPEFQGF
jgi:hypothetical protein